VIDVQRGFVNENSAHVLEGVSQLIDAFAARNIPTVFTRFVNQRGSPYEKLLGWTMVRDVPETDLHDAVIDRAELIIEKSIYSAFTDEFQVLVAERGWHTLVFCGLSTESCVLKTAVDAFERGLLPLVITDAIASDLGALKHEMGIAILEILIGKDQMMISEELLRRLDEV